MLKDIEDKLTRFNKLLVIIPEREAEAETEGI